MAYHLIKYSFFTNRWLSCYSCDACFDGDYHSCGNLSHTGAPISTQLERTSHDDGEEQNNENDKSDLSSFLNLIEIGHVLVVRAVDDDFYLFEARTEPFTLTEDNTDEYRTHYTAGTSVIEGLYYARLKNSLLKYKLLPKHTAMVPSFSVVRICSELSGKRIKVPEAVHQTIIDTLDDVAL